MTTNDVRYPGLTTGRIWRVSTARMEVHDAQKDLARIEAALVALGFLISTDAGAARTALLDARNGLRLRIETLIAKERAAWLAILEEGEIEREVANLVARGCVPTPTAKAPAEARKPAPARTYRCDNMKGDDCGADHSSLAEAIACIRRDDCCRVNAYENGKRVFLTNAEVDEIAAAI